MARHKLTKEEKIRGIRKALESKRTPARLKAGMRKYLERLEREK